MLGKIWNTLTHIYLVLLAISRDTRESASEDRKQTALLRAIKFRSGSAASIQFLVLEQNGMRFKFGVKVSAQDDDAKTASVQATLASGESVTAEAELVESTADDGKVTKSALVTDDKFVGAKGDLVNLKATLSDADGNPSPSVEDVGVIRDTIGPQAPVMSIVTLEQLPDAPPTTPESRRR
jgi:hypothetical protein